MDDFLKILQTIQMDHDTLVLVDAVLKERMRKEEINKRVVESFGEPVPYRKNGKDYFRISFRMDGKQIAKTAKTREEVLEKCFCFIEQQETTLRSVFQAFHEKRQKGPILSTQTVHYDVVTWNKHFEKHPIANRLIADITTANVREFFEDITGKGIITKKDFDKAKSLLNLVFDYAIIEGKCQNNVSRICSIKGLQFKLEKSKKNDVYRKDDVLKLTTYLKTLEPTVYTLGVRLHFCFCMRIGELRALTWEDYDEKARTMRIWHEIVKESDGTKNRVDKDVPHTKNKLESGERIVPVSEEAAKILAMLRKINGDKKYILNGTRNAKFSISENAFNEHLRKYCENAGIKYFSSHKARFFGITELYEAGVPEHIIQYIAGHASVQMTQHYNRPDYTQEIDRRIWDSIFGIAA